jgi:hypothetical protein
MTSQRTELSPVKQAEQALQVDGVFARMERRFEDGTWARGFRFGPDGGTCLIGAVDEATQWCMPGVAEEVTVRLAEQLPPPFHAIARFRPRLGLALYNDTIGGNTGALRLVSRARRALFVGGPAPVTAPVPQVSRPASWVS